MLKIDLNTVNGVLERASAAVRYAREVRELHRRRRAPDRVNDLTTALGYLAEAMGEVRPYVHSSVRRPVPKEDELRAVSRAIQSERRKLRKMFGSDLATGRVVAGLEAGWE